MSERQSKWHSMPEATTTPTEQSVMEGMHWEDDLLVPDVVEEDFDPEWDEYDRFEMSDVEADADALASCGFGTDEDYGG